MPETIESLLDEMQQKGGQINLNWWSEPGEQAGCWRVSWEPAAIKAMGGNIFTSSFDCSHKSLLEGLLAVRNKAVDWAKQAQDHIRQTTAHREEMLAALANWAQPKRDVQVPRGGMF